MKSERGRERRRHTPRQFLVPRTSSLFGHRCNSESRISWQCRTRHSVNHASGKNRRFGPECASGKILRHQRGRAFFDLSQAQTATRKNAFDYGALASASTFYTYVGNDPTNRTDPTGQIAGVDDAAAFLLGGVIGVGYQAVEDAVTGQQFTYGEAAGAFVAGGVVGVGTVNAPETGGVSFAAAVGGLAGAAGNATKQGVDIATGAQKGGFSTKEVAVSTVVGAALGGATEGALPNAKVPGLSSGRGNMNAVAKGVQTKIAKGEAQKMSAKTAVKAAVGSQAASAYKTAVGALGDTAKTVACSNTSQNVCGH